MKWASNSNFLTAPSNSLPRNVSETQLHALKNAGKCNYKYIILSDIYEIHLRPILLTSVVLQHEIGS